MSKTPWVVFDCKTGLATCQHCGEALNLPLPQPISVFVAASEAFRKLHEGCGKQQTASS
jgi:hypothetical protein